MTTSDHLDWAPEPPRRPSLSAALVATTLLALGVVGAMMLALDGQPSADEPVAEVEAPAAEADTAAVDAVVEEQDPATAALEAQQRVEALQGELAEAHARLEEVEAEEARRAERSEEARKRWAALEAEVARLQVALAEAETERDGLRKELASTLQQLDEQIARTARVEKERDIWKRASTDNLWAAFVQSTKVKLCDRGNRKSLARCHGAVADVMTAEARERFDHCLAARQSLPALVEVEKGGTPPAFSVPFPPGTRQIGKDWHVVYCDPTLPEAGGVADGELPDPAVIRVAAR